jgi:CheY-like chemotaxis protein
MNRLLLFIEDDEDDIYVMQNALERVGIHETMHFVRHGKEAVEYLQSCTVPGSHSPTSLPKMIFLDLNMPLMNGLEFLGWRSQQPALQTIPVVVLTSSESRQDIIDAYRLGANAYLVKPMSVTEFSSLLKSIQAFWLTHNRFAD